jgi:predicted  nucleic acid-binding Zn-ribbon protein
MREESIRSQVLLREAAEAEVKRMEQLLDRAQQQIADDADEMSAQANLLRKAEAERDALRAKLAAAEKDATRYRWLIDNEFRIGDQYVDYYRVDEVTPAIDAASAKDKP